MKKLKWLKNQLPEAERTMADHEVPSGTELISIINNIKKVNDVIGMTSATLNANTVWVHQEKAVNLSDAVIAFTKCLKLTYIDRIHRAPHNSGQNKAEPSNDTIGEALVDCTALHFECFQLTNLISEEELKVLTVEEIKELEAEAVEHNAWTIAQDVVSRIDGQPEPADDCMTAFVTNCKERHPCIMKPPKPGNTNLFPDMQISKNEKPWNFWEYLGVVENTCGNFWEFLGIPKNS